MPDNRILATMLDRLYASLMRGPSLNARPHNSRQRIDMRLLAALGGTDGAPIETLRGLLGTEGRASLSARLERPAWLPPESLRYGRRGRSAPVEPPPVDPALSPVEAQARREAERAWREQRSLLNKLRNLSEDARTYEQDSGVHALNIGFPLLSIPPGATGRGGRILAPLAFIPVSLDVRQGASAGIELKRRGEGVDLVVPNVALLAWLERESDRPIAELFEDEEGQDPWREIAELIELTSARVGLEPGEYADWASEEQLRLDSIPRTDDLPSGTALVRGAVLGLFPSSKQGLIRDVRGMIAADELVGPVQSFVDVDVQLNEPKPAGAGEPGSDEGQGGELGQTEEPWLDDPERFPGEYFVVPADPFQARAVAQARTSAGLVIHGPPGTGKSQTITNIIADHLARGQRVLFVCDKRTALDVVASRLDALGLSHLCALVHDSKRDQRSLYMAIRESLEELGEVKTKAGSKRALAKLNGELEQLTRELVRAAEVLQAAGSGEGAPSSYPELGFHGLVGAWMSIEAPQVDGLEAHALGEAELEACRTEIEVLLDRGREVEFPHNPWAQICALSLDEFLRRNQSELRRELASVAEDARAADNLADERIPPFGSLAEAVPQAAARTEFAERLAKLIEASSATVLYQVSQLDAGGLDRAAELLAKAAESRGLLSSKLDPELNLTLAGEEPSTADLNVTLTELQRYLDSQGRWYRMFAFGARSAAARALSPYGLAPTVEVAERVRDFLLGVRARRVARAVLAEAVPKLEVPNDDEALIEVFDGLGEAIDLLRASRGDGAVSERFNQVFEGRAMPEPLIHGLRGSTDRAAAIAGLAASLKSTELFDGAWLDEVGALLAEGRAAGSTLGALIGRFDTLDGVLRVRGSLEGLPDSLRSAARAVLDGSLDPASGLSALERQALRSEIERRLGASDELRRLDGRRLEDGLERLAELSHRKREVVRELILHQWNERQRKAVLASTGSRLNPRGAALRRRLFVRGSRAMRLRQMIAAGAEDGVDDPLFEMCPVWMASPETVAQVFARLPIFDVVIFDEASQCRLEEALPVLTRAKRAVIAGDPKQLPPTRFFEAAVATSDYREPETDQDLFESQQGEVEDLLAAALNIDIEEAFLDVHYRSRNADLIGFSNEAFYGSRLQGLPGHPGNRARLSPVRLDRVDGIYDDSVNAGEAERVVELVAELLGRERPPSIGIACFNLKQRDLIDELLEGKAEQDAAFGRLLAGARRLQRNGAHEGLFVKNLESVQGDERDHIIVSTTYGPNAEGRFYRRFGPLGQAGGGRRLNVLVTRARLELHIVTSIPPEAYRSQEPVPSGMRPSGGWLLLAYLRHVEALEEAYTEQAERWDALTRDPVPRMDEVEIEPVSSLSRALGRELAEARSIGSEVHWGNPGFCVDLALAHPERALDVTAGVLCDFNRYPRAPGRIAWEVFRVEFFRSQGWALHRVWSPALFHDFERELGGIEQAAQAAREESERAPIK